MRLIQIIRAVWLRLSGRSVEKELAERLLREKAARGVIPVERKNPAFVTKFPRGIHK
jgi:hypothetical protein